jgi:predicted metal-dependent HD superfamily phosphohydrolase
MFHHLSEDATSMIISTHYQASDTKHRLANGISSPVCLLLVEEFTHTFYLLVMELENHEECCHRSWVELSQILNLSDTLHKRWWKLLVAYFGEEQRYYHTFEHLHELLLLTGKHKHLISNYPVMLLSIFFHDIVYNPQSSHNEDDSNDVFLQFVIDCNSQLVSRLTLPVFDIIKMTKTHKIPVNADFDMQFFSDIDMGILGSDTKRYEKYAAQIRMEYSFVEFNTFCTRRSDFLLSCLSTDEPMFATDMFRKERGDQALDNIAWEHKLLKTFQCPIVSWKKGNTGDITSSRMKDTSTEKKLGCCGMAHGTLMLHVFLTVALVFPF